VTSVRRFPRVAALVLWPVLGVPVHAGIPYVLSLVGSRYGWSTDTPGVWNLIGLAPLLAGAGIVTWALAHHYRAAPRGWPVALRLEVEMHEYMLERGPYAFTRNPMYVGEGLVWIGWTIFYGSVAVLAGLGVFCTGVGVFVRREERTLTARFGDAYRAYTRRVPRWIGRAGV
jgi:protein-S-isoprenylcysteine O-methyltransferase Ste14